MSPYRRSLPAKKTPEQPIPPVESVEDFFNRARWHLPIPPDTSLRHRKDWPPSSSLSTFPEKY